MREVCELINGRAYNKAELLEDGKYRVLRVGNFFTNNHWYWSDLELEPSKYCQAGDLLYAWSASFGPRIWRDEKCIYHYHIWKVRPFADQVTRDFLYYFFEWDKERIRDEQGAGATMVHISKQSMEARDIPVPPLDEQKRIVAKLDQAFAALDRARANAEANLEDARLLFDAELQLAFEQAFEGREVLPFHSICEVLTPKVKLKRQDYLDEGAYPVVSQEAELVSGYWDDAEAVLDTAGEVVVFGDHTCCLKYVDFDFVVGADGTKVLKPSSGVSGKFLYYGLRSRPIQQTGYARHFKLLREASLPNLPIPDQHRMTERLGRLESMSKALARAYEAKLADIATLRQSLLQAAFSGQLN